MNAVSRDRAITALVAVMLACGLTGQAIARGERAGGGVVAREGAVARRLFSRRRCVGWRILVQRRYGSAKRCTYGCNFKRKSKRTPEFQECDASELQSESGQPPAEHG